MSLQQDKIISSSHLPMDFDLRSGAMILIDKPKGWTSFDVVNKVRHTIRHHLKIKKFKVGHSGTLDPMATGLLLLCIGKYTKLLHDLTSVNKSYSGSIKLGATTPSYDAESDEDQCFPTDHITDEMLTIAAQSFAGGYAQIPPIFSAIKVDGQALYKLARRGETIELKPRDVMIHSFDLHPMENNNVDFFCACGKGTYIRSLAFDLGKRVDSGGYLTALRRETVEEYNVSDALTVDEAVEWVRSVDLEAQIIPQ
ncbi:MAG: tRNA pseudouridine(55) synthase TruB [Saprospiraceae bacterium]